MKRFWCLLLCAVLFFSACGRHGDPLACFRRGFAAEVTGLWRGVRFAARFEAEPVTEAGVLPLTVTFYAPEGLAGAVLRRDAAGKISLTVADMTTRDGLAGFERMIALLPVGGEISRITVSENGQTVVQGADFCLRLQADGTPLSVTCGEDILQFLDWIGPDT